MLNEPARSFSQCDPRLGSPRTFAASLPQKERLRPLHEPQVPPRPQDRFRQEAERTRGVAPPGPSKCNAEFTRVFLPLQVAPLHEAWPSRRFGPA